MLDDETEKCIHQKLYRSRAIFARQSDFRVELKTKSTATSIAAINENAASNNNNGICIGHDIWLHIAMHLDPEDVQAFALVCKQTARLVNSRAFWRNMYKRYCLAGSIKVWNLELPAELQLEAIRNCDAKALRSRVIQSLFHCYRPFSERIELGYKLDWLLQRKFVCCSQREFRRLWFVYYTLSNRARTCGHLAEMAADTDVVNDWETLAEDDGAPAQSYANRHDGVVLLIVVCRQFMPLPFQLLYNQQQSRFRLKATRELLCTDMRTTNLELDFVEDNSSSNGQISITVKYSHMENYKVLPWWHPDFKTHFACRSR
ncbi:uncharacterized protein LOC6560207 isoform X2 [Drosophila grimshawi]|uniref:uncharacterized protein LOC6560207 isoform X2 n=1 Tax=Drosophila grimshawi TaxID=7222 RepID=UPI000C86EC88|nr:uncharacterized protein LOC6560207 isoform X2 [Drosophila grimshawi]